MLRNNGIHRAVVFVLILSLALSACTPRPLSVTPTVGVELPDLDPEFPTPGLDVGPAIDLYVASSGRDEDNNCQNQIVPCLTVDRAFLEARALPAVHIHIGTGTFTLENHTARLDAYVLISGAGRGSTIIDGSERFRSLLIASTSIAVVEDLTISNAFECVTVMDVATAEVTIRNVDLVNCIDNGILNRGSGPVEVQNVNIRDAHCCDGDGYGITNLGSMLVQNSVITGSEWYGILTEGNLTLVGGEISGNGADGIRNSGALFVDSTRLLSNAGAAIRHEEGFAQLAGVYLNNTLPRGGPGVGLLVTGNAEAVVVNSLVEGNQVGVSLADNASLDLSGSTIRGQARQGLLIPANATTVIRESTFEDNGSEQGPVIRNSGDLTISFSRLNDNLQSVLNNDAGATAAVYDSEFTGNQEPVGTSIVVNDELGELVLNRVLIAENQLQEFNYALANFGTLNLTNVTISGNQGNGLRARGETSLAYSTIADNTGHGLLLDGSAPKGVDNLLFARNGNGDCSDALFFSSAVTISGTNTDSDETCGFDTTFAPADLLLGPLADNGGATKTHELLTGSPAIDTASGACPGNDQRTVSRPIAAGCDVGAFEAGGTIASIVIGAPEEPELDSFTDDAAQPDEDMLIVTTDSGCFFGPGEAWLRVSTLAVDTEALIVGQGFGGGWMVVKHPSANTNCWIDIDDVEFDIPLDQLRLIAIPPKPTATPSATTGPREPTPCPTNPQIPGTCQ